MSNKYGTNWIKCDLTFCYFDPTIRNMERTLVTVQKILDLQPIPGADAIEVAQVLGWKCVVKRGEFSVGDICAYFEVDSLLPVSPWTDFLRKGDPRPFRLRTVTLRKQRSQGLALPFGKLPVLPTTVKFEIGEDITEALGVTKWEMQVPAELAGICKGNFPSFIPKTDEPRLQSNPGVIKEIQGIRMRGTLKMDGTSMTMFRTDRFGVCSRNMELCESDSNAYWKMANELNLQRFTGDWAIQGELCGPSIQGNRIGLTKPTFYAFSLYDIEEGRFLNHDRMAEFCAVAGINVVPTVFDGIVDPTWGVEEFLDFANKQVYQNGLPAEGVVWRPVYEAHSEALNGRLSFKTISNVFIDKYKE